MYLTFVEKNLSPTKDVVQLQKVNVYPKDQADLDN
jgi:hypothetical protein